MDELAVFPELLAVVGGDDHERVVPQPSAVETGEQDLEVAVEVSDSGPIQFPDGVERAVVDQLGALIGGQQVIRCAAIVDAEVVAQRVDVERREVLGR
jgi:hypothetical protein